jgi:hypothetical protein
MTRKLPLLALVAAAALAGCNKDDHTIVGGPPGDDLNAAANAGVTLPPAIAASKTYRCKDNSIVYIDWLSDGSARVKKTQGEVGTSLPAGSPQLKGTPTDASITYNGQSCKA